MARRKTNTLFELLLFWNICFSINIIYSDNVENNDRILVLKFKENVDQEVFRFLREHNFTHLHQITPTTHFFEYSGPQRALNRLSTFLRLCCRDKIIKVEHLREYKDTLRPVDLLAEEWIEKKEAAWLPSTNLVCDNYYGMGVHGAWLLGYTGRGVTVAVTDVGVNTDLEDLKDNINVKLSFNFIENNTDVTPEYFHNIRGKASTYTDHGNSVTSIIAAIKGNNLCSAGIAHNAKVVVLKIYRVKLFKHRFFGLEPSHWTRSDITSLALSYQMNGIDIFANAWAPPKAFDALDLAKRNAIEDGAENGRHGLGNIHVVPSGPPGNELSNNINTITVNSIGRYGKIPKYTKVDASVITSGLGDGNNLTSSFMVTTTLRNACSTGFNGVSAATSQIAAIIALALEANVQNDQKRYQVFCYTCKLVKKGHCLTTVEKVLVKTKLKLTSSDFSITLTSPSGTRSVLVNHISRQDKPVIDKKIQLVSVHFWGELAFGLWTLTLRNVMDSEQVETDQMSLTIYGTNNQAVSNLKHVYNEICDNETTSNHNYINYTTSKIIVATPSLRSRTEDNILDLTALYVICAVGFVVFLFYLIRKRYRNSFSSCLPTSRNTNVITEHENEINNEAYMRENND